ncbi:MAG: hypothetical protein LBD59_04830, partial [Prevotellaceae bacterium]|nr:hypothetical protein [Prevotellaceae bacterium]
GKKAGNLLPQRAQRLRKVRKGIALFAVNFAPVAVKKSQVYKLFISRPLVAAKPQRSKLPLLIYPD